MSALYEATRPLRDLVRPLLYWQAQRRFRRYLSGYSFISNNCVGGTLSRLAGGPYNSPTAGLWFTADGFRDFCARFPTVLQEPVTEDAELSRHYGYPVGDLSGIKIMFQHYETFSQAAAAWQRRAARVDMSRLLFVLAERDECGPEHVAAFKALPYPKLLLTARADGSRFAVSPPRGLSVADLHSWRPLARALPLATLRRLAETPLDGLIDGAHENH